MKLRSDTRRALQEAPSTVSAPSRATPAGPVPPPVSSPATAVASTGWVALQATTPYDLRRRIRRIVQDSALAADAAPASSVDTRDICRERSQRSAVAESVQHRPQTASPGIRPGGCRDGRDGNIFHEDGVAEHSRHSHRDNSATVDRYQVAHQEQDPRQHEDEDIHCSALTGCNGQDDEDEEEDGARGRGGLIDGRSDDCDIGGVVGKRGDDHDALGVTRTIRDDRDDEQRSTHGGIPPDDDGDGGGCHNSAVRQSVGAVVRVIRALTAMTTRTTAPMTTMTATMATKGATTTGSTTAEPTAAANAVASDMMQTADALPEDQEANDDGIYHHH